MKANHKLGRNDRAQLRDDSAERYSRQAAQYDIHYGYDSPILAGGAATRPAQKEHSAESDSRHHLSPRALAGRWGVGLATVGLVIGVAATLFA